MWSICSLSPSLRPFHPTHHFSSILSHVFPIFLYRPLCLFPPSMPNFFTVTLLSSFPSPSSSPHLLPFHFLPITFLHCISCLSYLLPLPSLLYSGPCPLLSFSHFPQLTFTFLLFFLCLPLYLFPLLALFFHLPIFTLVYLFPFLPSSSSLFSLQLPSTEFLFAIHSSLKVSSSMTSHHQRLNKFVSLTGNPHPPL